MKTLLLLSFCIYSVYANSSSGSSEGCSIKVNPDTTVQDVGPLTGKWYEVSNYGTPGSPICAITHYTLTGANTFSVFVNHKYPGPTYIGSGLGVLGSPGVMNVNVNHASASSKSTTYDYQTWTVLGTDYLNYLTGYRCNQGTPVVSILTRNPNPPQSVWNMALADATSQLPASYQLVDCSI